MIGLPARKIYVPHYGRFWCLLSCRNKFPKGWQRHHEALRLINGPDKSVDEISNVQNFVYTDIGGRMI